MEVEVLVPMQLDSKGTFLVQILIEDDGVVVVVLPMATNSRGGNRKKRRLDVPTEYFLATPPQGEVGPG